MMMMMRTIMMMMKIQVDGNGGDDVVVGDFDVYCDELPMTDNTMMII